MPFPSLRISIILALSLHTFLAAAQNKVLIPYRSGALWGLADTTGKLELRPQYLSVNFIKDSRFPSGNSLQKGFIIQSVKGYGFYTDREIVAPRYADLRFRSLHFIEAYNSEGKVDYVLYSGQPAVPLGWTIQKLLGDQYIETADNSSRYLFLRCLSPKLGGVLYVLPTSQPEKAQILLTQLQDIELADQKNGQLHFEAQKKQSDYEELFTYEYLPTQKQWVAANPKRPLNKERLAVEADEGYPGYDAVVEPAHYGSTDTDRDYNSYGGSGLGYGPGIGPSSTVSPLKRLYGRFVFERDSVFFTHNRRGDTKNRRLYVALPSEASQIQVLAYNAGTSNEWQSNDSAVVYSNFVMYRMGNRMAALCFYGGSALEFDSLERFPYAGNYKELFFVAGQRDTDGRMHMGIVNDSGQVIVPMVYDRIETGLCLGHPNSRHPSFRVAATQNGKADFISILNPLEFQGRYDAIRIQSQSGYERKSFFSLQKDQRFGAVLRDPNQSSFYAPQFFEPSLPYEIGDYTRVVQGQTLPFYLLKCISPTQVFMGYASSSGRLFFDH